MIACVSPTATLGLKVPTSGGGRENSQRLTSHLFVPRSISCANWTVNAATLFLGYTFIDVLLKSHVKAVTNRVHSRGVWYGNERDDLNDVFLYKAIEERVGNVKRSTQVSCYSWRNRVSNSFEYMYSNVSESSLLDWYVIQVFKDLITECCQVNKCP